MKVTVIGGGTGSSVVLRGLKKIKSIQIDVIVNMTDDGGSNKVIRDEYGQLPVSDLRKSIIALADDDSSQTLRELFTYRFAKGDGLKGHTAGNLIMTALNDITKSPTEMIDICSTLFRVKGKIIPVTLDQVTLQAEYEDGSKAESEHEIDDPDHDKKIAKFYSRPEGNATREAIQSIKNADFIILGPGDLYTTTIANLILEGIPEALQNTKARKIFISNITTKKGQTRGMGHRELLDEIETYSGTEFDYIVLNNGNVADKILNAYEEQGESLVKDNFGCHSKKKIVRADIVSSTMVPKIEGDELTRSLIRHHPEKLIKVLRSIFETET